MPQIPFRTGRTECTPGAEPYIASKTEVHPSPFANGPMTLQWFETNCGFTDPKDVVALMGAHTLGKLDQSNLHDCQKLHQHYFLIIHLCSSLVKIYLLQDTLLQPDNPY